MLFAQFALINLPENLLALCYLKYIKNFNNIALDVYLMAEDIPREGSNVCFYHGQHAIINFLNIVDISEHSAMFACAGNHTDTFVYLLEHNAAIDNDCLYLSIENDNLDIFKLLIDRNVLVYYSDIDRIIKHKHHSMEQYLMDNRQHLDNIFTEFLNVANEKYSNRILQ